MLRARRLYFNECYLQGEYYISRNMYSDCLPKIIISSVIVIVTIIAHARVRYMLERNLVEL